jgi:hypothetical protein
VETSHPFPFVGHGAGDYVEEICFQVLFSRDLSNGDKTRIDALAPELVRWDGYNFWGRVMLVLLEPQSTHTGEFVDEKILQLYGGEADEDGRPPPEALRPLERDIDEWLKKVHEFCPIAVALRVPDEESTGTVFSPWHEASRPPVLELFRQWMTARFWFAPDSTEEQFVWRMVRDIIALYDASDELPEGFTDALYRGYFGPLD